MKLSLPVIINSWERHSIPATAEPHIRTFIKIKSLESKNKLVKGKYVILFWKGVPTENRQLQKLFLIFGIESDGVL